MLTELKKIKDLVERFVRFDDQMAAREFFYLFYDKLISFAKLYVKTLVEAEDIVSEVFVKLFKKKEKLVTIEDIRFYLYKCVKYEALNHIKKSKKYTFVEHEEVSIDLKRIDTRNPETEFITDELENSLNMAINSLPKKRKLIYKLITQDQLKYAEVAELLGLSIKTVENHMTLAVKDIRGEISKYLNDSMQAKSQAGQI